MIVVCKTLITKYIVIINIYIYIYLFITPIISMFCVKHITHKLSQYLRPSLVFSRILSLWRSLSFSLSLSLCSLSLSPSLSRSLAHALCARHETPRGTFWFLGQAPRETFFKCPTCGQCRAPRLGEAPG